MEEDLENSPPPHPHRLRGLDSEAQSLIQKEPQVSGIIA